MANLFEHGNGALAENAKEIIHMADNPLGLEPSTVYKSAFLLPSAVLCQGVNQLSATLYSGDKHAVSCEKCLALM